MIVQTYFKKKRAFANGLASVGTGVGVLAMAPMVSSLEVSLGWNHTLMILGALMLACIPMSILFRPIEITNLEKSDISNEGENLGANHVGACMTDDDSTSHFMTIFSKFMPKFPAILFDVVFITCLVTNTLVNIGYAVPYLYTLVSIKSSIFFIKITLHLSTSLGPCYGYGDRAI